VPLGLEARQQYCAEFRTIYLISYARRNLYGDSGSRDQWKCWIDADPTHNNHAIRWLRGKSKLDFKLVCDRGGMKQ
jgi:hypothetical protein